jgi:hypothetical protein
MYEILAVATFTALYALGRHWWKKRRLLTASDWPTAEGLVAQIEASRDDNRFLVVTRAYTYKVADERYVGRESFPFIRDQEAAQFEAGCRQRSVQVHYRPDKPSVSVLARASNQ